MKAFVFNDVEYTELQSLGVAFAENYNKALEAVKEKAFLSFTKKFKKQKADVFKILYETRHMQNALTFLVYSFTEPKVLVVGGKIYQDFKEIAADIKTNPGFELFASERGFRKTILDTLEDEMLKVNLMALEDNFSNQFAIDFIANYYNYDSIDDFSNYLEVLEKSQEKFSTAYELFSNQDFKLYLAHKLNLQSIMSMTNDNCPVFEGANALKGIADEELIRSIFDKTFYMDLLDHLKEYSYKKKGKDIYKKLVDFKKLYAKKSKKGFSIEELISYHKGCFDLYLAFVDLYRKEKIRAKNQSAELSVVYCGTLVSNAYGEDKTIGQDVMAEIVVEEKVEYDLKKFQKSIRNHKHYARWLIFFSLIIGIYYGVASFVEQLKPVILNEFGFYDFLFIGGAAGALVVGIFILIMKGLANKKYNKLCLLKYYRNNESILTEKELNKKAKLETKELKYAKKIDRFYRFYGAIGNALLALAISILVTGVVSHFGNMFLEGFADNAQVLLNQEGQYWYFIFIPAGVVLLLGLLRHKKTAWSSILTFILSIGLTGGVIYLMGMM